MNDLAAPARLDSRTGDCAVSPGEPCDLRTLGAFEDLSGRVGEVSVLQCHRCGLGISMPPIPDVGFLYAGRETQDFQQDGSRLGHAIKTVAFRRQAAKLLAQLPQRPERVLDFGCGSGQFTRALGDLLGPAKVTGSDFETTPPSDLVDRNYLPAAELGSHADGFDLVLAMHVLEHDDDAAGLLHRIADMARPDGTVVIEVPNVECFWVGPFGKAWDAWYMPFHRSHFSRAALSALAEREGFEVMAVHNISVPTMGRSLSNLMGGSKGLFWLLVGIVTHPVQWLGERISGRPSAIRLIIRKVD